MRLMFTAWLCLLSCVAKAAPPYPFHFGFEPGQAFGFIGDDAVHDGRWCQYVENFFYTRYSDRKLVFYNAGVGTDTVADVLERLDADIVERKLDYAIIQLGTWDGGLGSFDPVRARVYQESMAELLDRLQRARIHPFLMSPPMVDARTHRDRLAEDASYRFRLVRISADYNGVMGYYAAWLGESAVERRVRFIDAWSALSLATSRERKTNPMFSLVPEGLLPDAGGHAVMAAAVIDSLSPERAGGSVDIQLTATGGDPAWRSKVTGGSLSQLSGAADRVSFLWQARYLPWAMPEEAFIGARLAEIDERFNRERLQVIGLTAGDYEVTVAGEWLATLSASELARGIDLHLRWDRPEYLRAREVARMNGERYRDVVRPMRDLWQEVKRVRANFPGDEERLARILAEVTPQLNALRLASRERADAIYGAAKPLAQAVELKRIYTKEELKALEAAGSE